MCKVQILHVLFTFTEGKRLSLWMARPCMKLNCKLKEIVQIVIIYIVTEYTVTLFIFVSIH